MPDQLLVLLPFFSSRTSKPVNERVGNPGNVQRKRRLAGLHSRPELDLGAG